MNRAFTFTVCATRAWKGALLTALMEFFALAANAKVKYRKQSLTMSATRVHK